MHALRGGLEASALECRAIAQVFGLLIVSLLEIIESLLVVLPRLGVSPLIVERLGLIMFGSKNGRLKTEQQQDKRSRKDQTSHPTIPIRISFPPAAESSTIHPGRLVQTDLSEAKPTKRRSGVCQMR